MTDDKATAKIKAEKRFWAKVGPHDDPTKCWLWLGSYISNGNKTPLLYGEFRGVEGKVILAHRFSYEMKYGPIPPHMTIDHVKTRGCTSTLCVNPNHLEAVTLRVNLLRGNSVSAVAARQTHCVHGHPFNKTNTYRRPDNNGRQCRICRREAQLRRCK